MMRTAPFEVRLKPYGTALVDIARERDDILCLSGDLTRQCEVDLFRDAFPDRFINGGMAEANLVGMAGGLARRGYMPFFHTFGVFATRRAYDQVAMAVAYPNLPVRLVGFMPGVSSPGGPSHQATDDVALMRALPNMTVVEVADATETRQAVAEIVDLPGPVYLRLKRGEIPVLFDDDHRLDLRRAQVLRRAGRPGGVVFVASGMMVASAAAACDVLEAHGVPATLVNVSAVKPLDAATILDAVTDAGVVVAAENHSVVGGLGSAVAETLAQAGSTPPLRMIGLQDVFASGGRSATHLFASYGLSTGDLVRTAWSGLDLAAPAPEVVPPPVTDETYAPV